MGELKERYIKKQRDLSAVNIRPPFPRLIKIDICNICNYACVFCPQSKQSSKKGNIDDGLCKQIIKDAYNAGAREICLSSTGEPCLNTKLESYIELCKDTGYDYIFFNTNGYLLDEERSVNIIKSGVDSVKVSINAGARKYEIIHGTEGYDRVIQNLKCFDRLRKEMDFDCKLYVSYVVTKFSADEVEAVKSVVLPYVDDVMIMNANNRGGIADGVDDILYAGEDDYSYQFPCSQIFNNVYVTAEGYMVACCQDFENNMVIADLNNISVSDAWNCDEFVRFRERFLKKDFKGLLCDNCLNNTHKPVMPLNKKYAGYEHSKKRIENLMERIDMLSQL